MSADAMRYIGAYFRCQLKEPSCSSLGWSYLPHDPHCPRGSVIWKGIVLRPFLALHQRHRVQRFPISSVPPLTCGVMWSIR